MHPVEPDKLYKVAQEKGTDVGSIWPNELQIFQTSGVCFSLMMTYMMMKTIRDQNSYNSKKHEIDPEKKQMGKSFEDIGGCEMAKEAIK